MARVKELERRFPEDRQSRERITTVVEHAVQGATTEEVRRELQEALDEAGTQA